VDDDLIAAARARIARQKGRLRGWRPLPVGPDVAVMALEVLGHVRDEPESLGMRVAIAGRTPEALDDGAEAAASLALRKRAVLGPDDPFVVESRGARRGGDEPGDDPLTWPWRTFTFHVPLARLPAIAGLATDEVMSSQ
jgi:hypothetical protein